jgi:ABC-type spermidine/putrescine transport system permease subunit II
VDVLLLALFAVPSTVVGIGLIGAWNRPGLAGAVYGTPMMLVLADVARFLPVAALVIGASVRQIPMSHEEAAAMSGAGWLRTARRIVWPQLRLGLAASWVIAFVLSFGELGASILVAPPGESSLPVRVRTHPRRTSPSWPCSRLQWPAARSPCSGSRQPYARSETGERTVPPREQRGQAVQHTRRSRSRLIERVVW